MAQAQPTKFRSKPQSHSGSKKPKYKRFAKQVHEYISAGISFRKAADFLGISQNTAFAAERYYQHHHKSSSTTRRGLFKGAVPWR